MRIQFSSDDVCILEVYSLLYDRFSLAPRGILAVRWSIIQMQMFIFARSINTGTTFPMFLGKSDTIRVNMYVACGILRGSRCMTSAMNIPLINFLKIYESISHDTSEQLNSSRFSLCSSPRF